MLNYYYLFQINIIENFILYNLNFIFLKINMYNFLIKMKKF